MQTLARAGFGVLTDVIAIVREALAIPVGIWLGFAERAGVLVLRAWQTVLRPALGVGGRAVALAYRWALRELTPARAVPFVVVAAVAALIASQFVNFRAVQVGAPDYSAYSSVAPAPERDLLVSTSAHGIAVMVLALAALVLCAAALRGRWRLARLEIVIGLAVVAISLFVDAPKGLDEGTAAIAYEGAHAVLLGGFWVQLAAGTVLCVCGPLLAAYLSPRRRPGWIVRRFAGQSRLERGVRSLARRGWSSVPRQPPRRRPRRRPRSRPRSRVQGARP